MRQPTGRQNLANKCNICGKNNHKSSECFYKKDPTCFKCGRKGHFANKCQQKAWQNKNFSKVPNQNNKTPNKTNKIEINYFGNKSDKIPLNINNKTTIYFELDTGAERTIVPVNY